MLCVLVYTLYNMHAAFRWVLKGFFFIFILNMGMAQQVACDNKCYLKENIMIIIKLCVDSGLSVLYC